MAIVVDDFELGLAHLVEFADMSKDELERWFPHPEAVEEYVRRQHGGLPAYDARHLAGQHDHAESRDFLSAVQREVVRVGDVCPECIANDDPRKVPLHPNCECEVITTDVETGMPIDTWQPVERWIRENGTLQFVSGNDGPPLPAEDVPSLEDLGFEPSTAMVLDSKDARFSDIARWLALMESLLTSGDYLVSMWSVDPFDDELVVPVVTTSLTTVVARRVILSLVKVGAPTP